MSRVRNRYPRIPCVVPFCRCGATSYPPGHEIICPKHYRLVDPALKARRRKVRVALKRRGLLETDRHFRLDGVLWDRIKRQAIERATGVSA